MAYDDALEAFTNELSELEKLRAENYQLRAENARLRGPFVWDEVTGTYSPAPPKEPKP